MGAVHPNIPFGFADNLRRAFGLRRFVETGTYLGDTTAWAAERFERVDTVEAFEPLHARARERFAGQDKVRLHLGDSRTVLPAIVRGLDAPSLFWLDAHWSGEGTAGETRECPLLDEIAAIDEGPEDAFVLIDDARYFMAPPPRFHRIEEWPDLNTVMDALRRRRPDAYTAIVDDVIYRVPAEARDRFIELLRDEDLRGVAANARWHDRSIGAGAHLPPLDPGIERLLRIMESERSAPPPILEIQGFNARNRDAWVAEQAKAVPAGARVLDVGAGTCPYRKLFAHARYEAHDFTQYEGYHDSEKGEGLYGTMDYVSDVTAIPVPEASFDFVLCTEVLEHVPEPIAAVAEMARILKPGGLMLLTAPLGSGLHQEPYHFYGGYTPHWYRMVAERFGLDVEEIAPNGGTFRHIAQECARVSWTLERHAHLHGALAPAVGHLFGELLPRFLTTLDDRLDDAQFTVGYHVRLRKR
jgi:SAM-dependent methyltransferase